MTLYGKEVFQIGLNQMDGSGSVSNLKKMVKRSGIVLSGDEEEAPTTKASKMKKRAFLVLKKFKRKKKAPNKDHKVPSQAKTEEKLPLVPAMVCIGMNDLEFARTRLDDLVENVANKEFEKSVSTVFSYLKKKVDNMVIFVVFWVTYGIQAC